LREHDSSDRDVSTVKVARRIEVAAEFTETLANADEIELTVTGRVSGRKTSRPVWFVEEGGTLYLLPVKGSETEWYRNVLQNANITLSAQGVKWTGKARPITDPDRVREVVQKFRAKYGADQVKKYYSKFDVAVEVPLAR
jgi:hypothetical protein